MKHLIKFLLFLFILSGAGVVTAGELVLVVNKDNPNTILTKSQVIDLYMGKFVAFPDGSKAVPVDIDDNLDTKKQFYDSLVGMPLRRVNAYWSKVKFSGRARPPTQQKDEKAVLDFLMKTDNAIAYIHESNVTSNVKVVYRFDE